ncbi:hypothetical protein [Nostoc sp.]|uniref:hypothetical protein n=1 Tax=Nostoc sp. TaxID=1180 RepID=UPI002FFD0067
MSTNNPNTDPIRQGKIDYKRGYLTLPFTQDQFSEFISGLFGKLEELERDIECVFDVELGDVINIYYVIEDRIIQQNKGTMIQFSTKIFYDDNSSILLNKLESLSNYVEARSVIPIRMELVWEYLIQFPNKTVPEKQIIEIYIISDQSLHYRSSKFKFKIKYTSRSWATDIDSMLTEHIKNFITVSRQSTLKKYISSNDEVINVVITGIFILLSVIGSLIIAKGFIYSQLKETAYLFLTNPDLNTKIDFLINHAAEGKIARFYFFLLLYLLIMILSSTVVSDIIRYQANNYTPNNYILLTKKAKKEKEKNLKIEKNQLINFLLSIVLSFIVNLLSSYIFMRLYGS